MSGLRRRPFIQRNIVADMKGFDWEVYLLNYPELVGRGIRTSENACDHYKKIGFWEKRSCKVPDSFDAEKYMKTHSRLGFKTPRDAYIHFKRIGPMIRQQEGFRRGTQAFRIQPTNDRYHAKNARKAFWT